MADPYQVLGLSPDASIDDAEQAYHHRLLRCHPDLHASEGREAVARAEAQTRELNEAIDRIRHGHRPTARSSTGSTSGSGSGSARASAGASSRSSGGGSSTYERSAPWPGTADRSRAHAPVPCPFCGEAMTSLAGFEEHLTRAHPAQARTTRKATRRHARADRWWWPVPIWLFAVLDAVLVASSIAVVAAMGGHWALVENVLGDDAPGRCAEAMGTAMTTGACDQNDWPLIYIYAGVMALVFFAAWRWTTTKRER